MNLPVTSFDALYLDAIPEIPVAFLRRLAAEESNSNPASNDGPGKGLLQITPSAALDYEETHGPQPGVQVRKVGRRLSWVDYSGLFDPAVNVRYAAQTLGRVLTTYRRHPWGESANWADWNFAGLVVFGWNAGYSDRRGVGRAARDLEASGSDVTVEAVRARAELLGPDTVAATVADRAKAAWSRMVARRYFADAGAKAPPGKNTRTPTAPAGGAVAALALLALLG